jgi:4'-phosphopantetheinyl transferase
MQKLFYTDKNTFEDTATAVREIFSRYFHIDAEIMRSENGKPFLKGKRDLFFSVSHTDTTLFIAVSDENIGIDAERTDRDVRFLPIIKRFPFAEQKEIGNVSDFLRHWTAKESAVKWLGGTLARDLYKLEYANSLLRYGEVQLPVQITRFTLNGCFVAVCCEHDFSQAEIVAYP